MTVPKKFEDFALAMNIIFNLDDETLENAKHWIELEMERRKDRKDLPESCQRAHAMRKEQCRVSEHIMFTDFE